MNSECADISDTIVAPATPAGPSAIAMLRISGLQAFSLAGKICSRPPRVGAARFTRIVDQDQTLDEAVVIAWAGPHSYTGEDIVEICCHGNMAIVGRILDLCCRHGARHAGPGEFTQRAFLNGKMDLTQAEAVMDVIQARGDRALRAARLLREGKLGEMLRARQEVLLEILAHLEAYIDFPDEDIHPETGARFRDRIADVQETIERLLATAREGKMLREGLHVVLAGAPNAGKSSLLNALVQRERAIVSGLPGTTRDTIEEPLFLHGICIRLTDTAGLRSDPGEIEAISIRRTQEAMAEADLILHVIDSSLPVDPCPAQLLPGHIPALVVLAKADLPRAYLAQGIPVSSVTGEGLDELKQAIADRCELNESAASHDLPAVNARHETLLCRCAHALGRAIDLARKDMPPELISADLRDALGTLNDIVGETTNEDILNKLFSAFCIGK
jgi:tRNA modification GTPase